MLTRREQNTLDFIREFIQEKGYAPTMAEIAVGLGIRSKGVVHRYVKSLEEAKQLNIIPNRRRNIQLINLKLNHVASNNEIPLLGKIAAGRPIEAIVDDRTVDLNHLTGDDRYALKVVGDSMIEDGIYDGDLVICEKSETAPNGAIVVALIDQQCATLKRLYRNADNTVTLKPANAEYLPLIYESSRVDIQGIFVGLVRMAKFERRGEGR